MSNKVNKPIGVEVEAGKDYYFCTCGESSNQPWCDGSHRKTPGNHKPLKWTATETKKGYFCRCKESSNLPFCDGTHRSLESKITDIEDLGSRKTAGHSSSSKSAPNRTAEANTEEEPTLLRIKALARDGLEGEHGEVDAMGVPWPTLPRWSDIQFLTGQLATRPLLDHHSVETKVVIGPTAQKPLILDRPIFVSDMSFGALSANAKVCLATGAEMAGTGICSGEGGMLPEEQKANSKYFYELASAKFGWDPSIPEKGLISAFHFKGGQGAKCGTGGHLTGAKVTKRIADVRKLKQGEDAISPATFPDLKTPEDFKAIADDVRAKSGGIPIGFKLSAQHIEDDIDFALEASADYIIIDGRGGATGAAPTIFRDNISVPTIAAVARARAHLDRRNASHVTLIATGGLRVPEDFAKALALGADAVAISNSALQSIGCVAARMCHTNLCPAGIATQNPALADKLDVKKGAQQLYHFLIASTKLMQILAAACGHTSLTQFCQRDITTWKRTIADLTGIQYAGVTRRAATPEKSNTSTMTLAIAAAVGALVAIFVSKIFSK